MAESNFKKLENKFAKEGKRSPGGLAAAIGRRIYGKKTMTEAAEKGVPASSIKKHGGMK